MTTLIIMCLVLGALMGAIIIELLRVDPLRRDLEAARKAAWEKERRAARDRFDRAKYVHVGTPYRAETIAAAGRHASVPAVVSSGVGLRVVGGEQMYSAEWLNDDAKVDP